MPLLFTRQVPNEINPTTKPSAAGARAWLIARYCQAKGRELLIIKKLPSRDTVIEESYHGCLKLLLIFEKGEKASS